MPYQQLVILKLREWWWGSGFTLEMGGSVLRFHPCLCTFSGLKGGASPPRVVQEASLHQAAALGRLQGREGKKVKSAIASPTTAGNQSLPPQQPPYKGYKLLLFFFSIIY